jgi:hypothetical protein
MGFFDRFRSKSSANMMQDEMKRLAPILFPGGQDEIESTGKSISGLLDNRSPPDAAARLFASTKYLAHTTTDPSKQRIVTYILRQGMGRILESEAGAIYDRFIAKAPVASKSQPAPVDAQDSDALYVDDSLSGQMYRLQNSSRKVEVNAMIFTVMLVGLKSQGWKGAADLFSADGTAMKPLSGSYAVSDRDARALAAALQQLVAGSGLDGETESMVRPLISIAAQGAFTLHA